MSNKTKEKLPNGKDFFLKNSHPHIKFDKNSIQVNEPLANPYGFDLTDDNAIGFEIDKLRFTIMGFKVIKQFDSLIATIKVSLNPHLNDEYTYIQKIDLFNADRVEGYSRTGAYQLNVNQAEIKKGLCSLRERLTRYKLDKLKEGKGNTQKPTIHPEARKEALDILKADNLMECVEGLLEQAGVVTEKQNGLRLFLILLSRHFDKPLHALLQGSSTLSRMLLDTVTGTLPPEKLHEQTSMSNSSLYYTTQKDYWKNRVLYANYMDKHFKGVRTIKEFIDNLKLKRQTTEADFETRQLYATHKEVSGPICLVGYTEDESLYQHLLQECFFIRVEENATNRKAMLDYQKREYAGMIDKQAQKEAQQTLMTIQCMVEPIKVIVPFAMELDLPSKVFQPLRSYDQLLTFVKAVALLHQYQVKKKTSTGETYIEATHEHLEIAIELIKEIMIQKSDLLSHSQRSFFTRLKKNIKDPKEKFKAQEIMQKLGMKKSNFYKYFNQIKEQGLIEKCGGDKKNAEEFRITHWDNYEQLTEGMNVLDEQLKHIKKKFP